MAADLTHTIDQAELEKLTGPGVRDVYRRALAGRVCRTHGRTAKVSEPDPQGEVTISGCCDAFVREASRLLN